MTDTDRAVDDIRYLPWEAKHPPKRQPKPRVRLITVADLEPHHCRWPLGTDPYHFCGADKVPAHSYCVIHLKLAYKRGYADGA